jgi:hypothetical protein
MLILLATALGFNNIESRLQYLSTQHNQQHHFSGHEHHVLATDTMPKKNPPVLIPAGNLSVCICISQHEPPSQVSRQRPPYLPTCLPDPQVLTGFHSCRMPAFQATGHLAGRQASEHKTVHPIPSLCTRPAAPTPPADWPARTSHIGST